MNIKLPTEHNFEFISLKGDCTGSSESTLVKMPHCWKSHVTAHLSVTCHIHGIVASCLINVVYLTTCTFIQVMMTSQFLIDVANDAELRQKSNITS